MSDVHPRLPLSPDTDAHRYRQQRGGGGSAYGRSTYGSSYGSAGYGGAGAR